MKTRDHKKTPRVAIVHDWLTNMGGAENVVLAFHEAFPEAPIYTSTYDPEKTPAFDGLDIRTTFLQKLPGKMRNLHKFMPMLRVAAFRQLDLSDYDVILSSSSAEAKQVRKTRSDQIHICYCHTPIRYYWSHYDEYRANPGFGKLNWLIRLLMPLIVPPLKRADYQAAQQIDQLIGNSSTVRDRIKLYYNQPASVIHPPVNTKRFSPSKKRGDFYVALSRNTPYKRLDLAITAANQLKVPLRVFSDQTNREELIRIAGPTVTFHSGSPDKESQALITQSLNSARGFIFPAEEDFGISQVEAMAGGTPVIAYGAGGATDIIVDGETGVFFNKQDTESVAEAIKRAQSINFSTNAIRRRAEAFDKDIFIENIRSVVLTSWRHKS